MEAKHFVNNLKEELTCPICLDVLQDAVTLKCGHNFCLGCISQNGKEKPDNYMKCPVCKKTVKKNYTLRHNCQLVNLVEKIQAMDSPAMLLKREELICQKHGEKLHYFCEDDGRFICSVCRESKDHKAHTTVVMDEAAQSYQETLQSHITDLQQKENTIRQTKKQGEQKIDVFMTQVEREKKWLTTEFKKLYEVLKEEENFLLTRTYWLSQETEKAKKFFTETCEEQLNLLGTLTNSVTTRLHLPPSQLLQNIKALLHRSEKFQFLSPTPISLELEKKLSEVRSRNANLSEDLEKFKDKLQTDGKREKYRFFKGMREDYILNFIGQLSTKDNFEMNNTLEPNPLSSGKNTTNPLSPGSSPSTPLDLPTGTNFTEQVILPPSPKPRTRTSLAATSLRQASAENLWGTEGLQGAVLTSVLLDESSAHPDLVFSLDLKSVTLGFLPDSENAAPGRFHPFRCALGSELPRGCVAWEVELVGPDGGACALGVASPLAERRGFLVLEPPAGFWVLRVSGSGCQALTGLGRREELPVRPRRVGVCVDVERGQVRFYDALAGTHIYTFHNCFTEGVVPFFRLLLPGTAITLRP